MNKIKIIKNKKTKISLCYRFIKLPRDELIGNSDIFFFKLQDLKKTKSFFQLNQEKWNSLNPDNKFKTRPAFIMAKDLALFEFKINSNEI